MNEPLVVRRRPGVTAWLEQVRDRVDALQQQGYEVVITGPLAMALAASDPHDHAESSLWLDFFVARWGDGPVKDLLDKFAAMPYLGVIRTPQSERWAELYRQVCDETRGMTDHELRAELVRRVAAVADPHKPRRREPAVPITHWMGYDVDADQQPTEGQASGARLVLSVPRSGADNSAA